MKNWLWILAGLLTLIPLSVDDVWSIPIGGFRLRINYFGAALGVLLILWERLVPQKRYFKEPFVRAFGLMAVFGALAVAQSPSHFRSLCFLVWSSGTLILVPYLMEGFLKKFGAWAPRALIAYLALQSVIILLDSAICMPTGGAVHIGRVLVYAAASGNLCRPHAWYHEPGFFSAFAILGMLISRVWLDRESNLFFKKFTVATIVLTAFAIIASTSRMGWLGVLVFAGFEFWRISPELRKKIFRGIAIPAVILIAIGAANWYPIYNHVGRGVIHPTKDGSFKYRSARLQAGYDVFKQNPWIGAGPGVANVYFATYIHSGPLMDKLDEEFPRLAVQPLSQNLYTELLSEWGLFGTVLFFAGLVFMFREVPIGRRVELFALLLVIYTSSETLPRFDLWAALGLIRALASPSKFPTSSFAKL